MFSEYLNSIHTLQRRLWYRAMAADLSQSDPNSACNEVVFTKVLMWILTPSGDLIKRVKERRNITLDGNVPVPLPYIRHVIQKCSEIFYQFPPTHILCLITPAQEVRQFPVHDVVLEAQCFNLVFPPRRDRRAAQVVVVKDVLDLESFRILLAWLYTNDEKKLSKRLIEHGVGRTMVNFVLNCRFWGVVDARIQEVVWRILT